MAGGQMAASTPAPELFPLSDERKQSLLSSGSPLEVPEPKSPESHESKAARTVQAAWLNKLVDKETIACSLPIKISNAIIEGPLRWRNAKFTRDVVFSNCEFRGEVDMSFATFEQTVSFRRSAFRL